MLGAADAYVRDVLDDPAQLEANVEAIADAVGFCARHAGLIANVAGNTPTIDAVLERASRAILALFDARPGGNDRLKDILFSAASACPACAFEDRRLTPLLAHRAASLRRRPDFDAAPVCLPHFHGLIDESQLSDLRAWAAMQGECIAAAAAALDADTAEAMTAATGLIAGTQPAPAAASLPAVCPVCAAMTAARTRWQVLARESLRTGAAPEMLLPLCGQHIWSCHADVDGRLAEWTTRTVLKIAARNLRLSAIKIEDEERKLERSKASVWYRARNPAYILGQRRRIVSQMPRCAACERIAVARDRAVSDLLEQLQSERGRELLERDGGLCMKHFALARVIAPAGVVRDALTTVQVGKLATLVDQLRTKATKREIALALLSCTAS